MGEHEQKHYQPSPYDEADVLARKVLRGGAKKLLRDCYNYKGQTYWIVAGKCLTREQAEKLEDERRREGRTRQHVNRG